LGASQQAVKRGSEMRTYGLLTVVFLIATGVTAATAQQIGSGGQIAAFNATLIPSRLPRDRLAPIEIRTEGKFRATAANHLAQLNSLEMAINRHGQLFTKGLPVCRMRSLIATSTHDALAACGNALVGHGRVSARNFLPEQPSFVLRATTLAFNGRQRHGGTQFLFHVHGESPWPFTIIIPVKVHRERRGDFETFLFAKMPPIARRWAYLTKFKFTIGRRFMSDGKEHSLLQASCPAPQGSNAVIFPFAQATYRFRTTKTLRTTLVGGCHVSKESSETARPLLNPRATADPAHSY